MNKYSQSLLNLTRLPFLVLLPVYAVCFLGFKSYGYTNSLTLVYALLICATMALAISYSKNKLAFLSISMIAIFVLFSFTGRMLQYFISVPEDLNNLYVLFPYYWDSAVINNGLGYALAGLIAIILGVFACEAVFPAKFEQSPPKLSNLPIIPLTIASTLVILTECYFTLFMGMSASANCTKANVKGSWLIHFFSADMVFYVICFLGVSRWNKLTKKEMAFLAAFSLTYIIYTVLQGSRGGGMRMFLILSTIVYALYPFSKRFSIKSIILPILGFALVSLCAFYMGNAFRGVKSQSCDGLFSSDFSGFNREVKKNFSDQLPALFLNMKKDSLLDQNQGRFFFSLDRVRLPNSISGIMGRLGVLDYVVGIRSIKGNEEQKDKYMNLTYPFKNIYNNLVIGEPFPEAKYMTSNMMPLIYRSYDFTHIEENFLSEPWTPWGIGYTLFGEYGGLAYMFTLGFVMHILLIASTKLPPHLNKLAGASFLWFGSSTIFIGQSGIDHALTIGIYFVFQFGVTVALIDLLNLALNKKTYIFQRRAQLKG